MQTTSSNIQQTIRKQGILKTKQLTISIFAALFILLWTYTAGSKMIAFQQFKQ